MDASAIPAQTGALKRRKRVGRGIGSGHGKTSTRGQKGQRARTGSRKHPGFEGGQNPLIRSLPKRGFRDKTHGFEPRHEIVNVEALNQFADGAEVTPETLKTAGLIRTSKVRIKLLGDGALTKRLTIRVHQASAGAAQKVAQAGGTLQLLPVVHVPVA